MNRFPSNDATSLTLREIECLQGLAAGMTNTDISKHLDIALPTVAMHLVNARRKLGAKTREQAVAKAVRAGIVDA